MNYAKNKGMVVTALEAVREDVCIYSKESPVCDCKYGRRGELDHPAAENNGCPELRTVIDLLNNMTEAEYHYILRRGDPVEGRVNVIDIRCKESREVVPVWDTRASIVGAIPDRHEQKGPVYVKATFEFEYYGRPQVVAKYYELERELNLILDTQTGKTPSTS